MKQQIKNIIKPFIPSLIRDYFKDLHARISNLEFAIDVLIQSPNYVSSSETGFNGQRVRKEIFEELTAQIKFDSIIETGTYIGDTTGYMAETTKLPIYTSEISPRFHAIARNRIAHFSDINMELSDSRDFLKKMAESEHKNERVFFYLDAHWYADLPLKTEIDLIAHHWNDFVIMIDDFKVPNDDGYGYDDYGKNGVLSIEYIRSSLVGNKLVPFFPSKPSNQETGAKRGTVIITRQGELCSKVDELKSLSKANNF